MAYEPSTEAGRKALAEGADPSVVEVMEKDGDLKDDKTPEHVEPDKKPDEPPNKKEEDEGSKEGEGGKEEEDEQDQGPDRTPRHMPVWKAKELAKQEAEEAVKVARAEAKAEYDAELAKMGGKPGGPTTDDIKKVSEELGMSEDTAKVLIERTAEIVGKSLGIEQIRKDQADSQVKAKEIAEAAGYETEWASKDTQDALKAAAGGKEISGDVKKKVNELAYSTTYAKYRLSDIIRLNQSAIFPDAPIERRSAEAGKGGAGRGPSAPKSLDDVTPDQINDMSDEEFNAFSTEIGGKGSRFTRTTKSKK